MLLTSWCPSWVMITASMYCCSCFICHNRSFLLKSKFVVVRYEVRRFWLRIFSTSVILRFNWLIYLTLSGGKSATFESSILATNWRFVNDTLHDYNRHSYKLAKIPYFEFGIEFGIFQISTTAAKKSTTTIDKSNQAVVVAASCGEQEFKKNKNTDIGDTHWRWQLLRHLDVTIKLQKAGDLIKSHSSVGRFGQCCFFCFQHVRVHLQGS